MEGICDPQSPYMNSKCMEDVLLEDEQEIPQEVTNNEGEDLVPLECQLNDSKDDVDDGGFRYQRNAPERVVVGLNADLNFQTAGKFFLEEVDDVVLLEDENDNIFDSANFVDDGIVGVDNVIVPEVGMKFNDEKEMFNFYKRDQYAIAKFGESFEMVPKTLAENAGLNAMEIISSLYAENALGNTKVGIKLEEGVWDLYITKYFALKYAADAACTVLPVDQFIMAKPAGGPRREPPAGMDED